MGISVGAGSQRIAAVGGVSTAALILASFFISGEPPAVDAPGEEITKYVTDNRTAVLVTIVLTALALPLFFLLAAALRKRHVAFVGEDLATLGLVSGLLYWLVIAVGTSVFYGVAWIDGVVETVSPNVMQIMWNVGYVLCMTAMPLGALFLAVAAIAGLRGAHAKWYGLTTAAIAGLMLVGVLGILSSDLNLIFLAGTVLFVVWILVTSALMLRERTS